MGDRRGVEAADRGGGHLHADQGVPGGGGIAVHVSGGDDGLRADGECRGGYGGEGGRPGGLGERGDVIGGEAARDGLGGGAGAGGERGGGDCHGPVGTE